MSIFQAKEWWSCTVGENEEFDHNSVCIANIDNEKGANAEEKIVVGSFEGKLRVYKPNRKRNNAYHVEDLIIEKDMGYPILQVAAGKFCKGVPALGGAGICLAVLSTRLISLVTVQSTASFSKLTELQCHKLDRNAFNFIHGSFGNENDRNEQICVQSVDGALIFIDDESILFKIQLPDYLVPGPMLYSANSRSIIIANSNLEVECYNYQSMKAFTNNDIDGQKEGQAAGEKKSALQPTWTANIGEQAREMRVHFNRYLQSADIVVLGEQSFFILNEHGGKLRYQKRLSFAPSCFLTYHLKNEGDDLYVDEGPNKEREKAAIIEAAATSRDGLKTPGFMTLMGSFEGYLMVYRDTKLAWTTKLQALPIFVCTAAFQQQTGLIVTLSDAGLLQISYLGTDQMSQTDLGKLHQSEKDADYELMDQKHQQVLERINNQEHEQVKMPSDVLNVNIELGSKIEQCNEYLEDPDNKLARSELGQLFRMRVKVMLSYQQAPGQLSAGIFKNIQIDLRSPFGTMLEKTVVKYENLTISGGTTPPTEITYMYALQDMLPNDLDIEATCTYQQMRDERGHGQLRTSCNTVTLPTSFFLRLQEPQKENLESKLQFQMANGGTLGALPDVFAAMFVAQNAEDSLKQRRNISFQYHDGNVGSILVSKDEQKIRVQTNSFYQQWLILRELTQRLEESHPGKEIFEILQFNDTVPLTDLFEIMEEHFNVRAEASKLLKMLETRTIQFRMIQKRLLNRFKDKNPSPLNNLDFLLNHTYDQIIEMAMRIEKHKTETKKLAQKLACSLEVVLLLLRIKARLPKDQFVILKHFIPCDIDADNETGWEESTLASVQHLLKSGLNKASKHSQIVQTNTKMSELPDTTKLKNSLQTLVDQIIEIQATDSVDFSL